MGSKTNAASTGMVEVLPPEERYSSPPTSTTCPFAESVAALVRPGQGVVADGDGRTRVEAARRWVVKLGVAQGVGLVPAVELKAPGDEDAPVVEQRGRVPRARQRHLRACSRQARRFRFA